MALPTTLTSPTLTTNTSRVTGQGDEPVAVGWVSFRNPDGHYEEWQDVTAYLRGFSIRRGRSSELEFIDPGTATLYLDNQDRRFEPEYASSPYYPNVLPNRRVKIRGQWAGQTYDLFTGFVESWPQEWTLDDAVVGVRAVDAFKPLSYLRLPNTSPPRDSHPEVVKFDLPTVYLELNEPAPPEVADSSEQSSAGLYVGTYTHQLASLVLGDAVGKSVSFNPTATNSHYLDFVGRGRGSLSQFTFECLLSPIDMGSGGGNAVHLAIGPEANVLGTPCWNVEFRDTSLSVGMTLTNSTQAAATWTFGSSIVAGGVYFIVARWDGTNLKLEVDDVERASATPAAGMAAGGGTEPTRLRFLRAATSAGAQCQVDEVAYYESVALATARRTAHYQSARLRGYPQETSSGRIRKLLEEGAPWLSAGGAIRTGQRQVLPVRQRGQHTIEEIRSAEEAETGLFFIRGDGAAVFLDRDFRTVSPWNTSQGTFGDTGSELQYEDLATEFDDALIYNVVRVTREGGETQEATDTTSRVTYLDRVLEKSGVIVVNDTEASNIAMALKNRYKDPAVRFSTLALPGIDTALFPHILGRELADLITVKKTPPNGGTALQKNVRIGAIEIDLAPDDPVWRVRWSLLREDG
jgi:hypothetical protein